MKYFILLLVVMGCDLDRSDGLNASGIHDFTGETRVGYGIFRYENTEVICYKSSEGISCLKK